MSKWGSYLLNQGFVNGCLDMVNMNVTINSKKIYAGTQILLKFLKPHS